MTLVAVLLALAALPVVLFAGYLFTLSVLALRSPVTPAPSSAHRFDVLVPAHNEEAGIARTVENLLALDYPKDRFRVRVIADNCTDATAQRAQEAGADVLVRMDAVNRGKGFALEHAFALSLSDGFADALVVVDADSVASPNLLRAFSSRLAAGAQAVQAEYGVANPDASWRTRLMTIAFALFHRVRSLGRERLAVSCGLRGNGMCFSRALVQSQPHRAHSLVEDIEYGIQLGRAGERVHFAHEASVDGEMVAHEKASRSQRRRWEEGRVALRREHARPLLVDGVRQRSGLLFDLGMDLVVPPLAQLVLITGVGLVASVAFGLLGEAWCAIPWAIALGMLTLHVVHGWHVSASGWQGVAALARAPLYLGWKLWTRLRGGSGREGWVRTAREGELAR